MTASLDQPTGLDEPVSATFDEPAVPVAGDRAPSFLADLDDLAGSGLGELPGKVGHEPPPPPADLAGPGGQEPEEPAAELHRDMHSFGPPAPAWLLRGPVRRARRTKAIATLTVLALTAAALGWAVVMLVMKGMAIEPAGAFAGPAGQLVYPAPGTAGGLPRHSAVVRNPATRLVIAQFRRRFSVVLGGSRADYPAALYNEPGKVDLTVGSPAWLMYLGFNSRTDRSDPAAAVTKLMASLAGPHGNVRPWQVPPGPAGGMARCVVAIVGRTQVAVCGWATGDTIGAVLSPTRDTSVSELAVLMSRMRPDLQPG
jgi:hypothetical protein